ncbi:hypothetical protein HZA97_02105 [Candidatus Woesearchaeota archaeon]|nr:hypothetical protein [Candidatus Woesearchaeota archaeon]
MSEVPKVVDMEISDDDLQSSLVKILTSMESLRREQMKENLISDESKNEYLHLTYRLASILEGFARDEKENSVLTDRMQLVMDVVSKNNALLSYDFLQDDFWRGVEPEFSKTLDLILIRLKGDAFSGLQDKHHIINAIKYLAGSNLSFDDKVEVYDTILPYNTPNTKLNEKFFKEKMKELGIEGNIEDLILEAKNVKNLDSLLYSASLVGVSRVKVKMDYELYQKKYSKYSNAMIIDVSEVKGRLAKLQKAKKHSKKPAGIKSFFGFGNKEQEYLETEEEPLEINKEQKIALVMFDLTRDVTYLESKHSKNLDLEDFESGEDDDFTDDFDDDSESCVIGSDWNYDPNLGLQQKKGSNDNFGSLLVPLGYSKNKKSHKKQNKIDELLSACDKKTKKRENTHSEGKKEHNNHPLLEQLAQKVVEQENNLVWSRENHHTQGKYFSKELLQGIKLGEFQNQEYLERECGARTFYDLLQSGPYNKTTAIVCFKDERYALTLINESELDFAALSKIFAQQKSCEEKINSVAELTQAHYIHLSQYKSNEKTKDLTFNGGIKR